MIKIRTRTGLLRTSALPSILSVLGLVAAMATTPASAAKFGVKIVNESGQAIEGAAVCIGMHGNYGQFGSMHTDESGLAMVEVPKVPFVLTVSKSQMGSMRINEPARGFNLIKQVTLKQGNSAPKCKVDGLVMSDSSIRVSDIQITESPYATTLSPQVVGAPTQYRVSKTRSFLGAKWKRFETSIPLSASLSQEDKVYLQMRRYEGTKKSWIEARSDIINVMLPTFD